MPWLGNWQRHRGVERLHVHDRMPHDVLKRCTAAADIGLVDRPTVDNFRFQLPNKLFDSLYADAHRVLGPAGRRTVRGGGRHWRSEASAQGDAAIAKLSPTPWALMARPPSTHLAAVAGVPCDVHEEALYGRFTPRVDLFFRGFQGNPKWLYKRAIPGSRMSCSDGLPPRRGQCQIGGRFRQARRQPSSSAFQWASVPASHH